MDPKDAAFISSKSRSDQCRHGRDIGVTVRQIDRQTDGFSALYSRYLDIYDHINCLTFKCNTNTKREVYWKFSDKITSIEMCNNHEYSIMQILFKIANTTLHSYIYIVYGSIQNLRLSR